ncbi:MAG: hypothetical protein HOP25_04400 [Methylotenera sp.]|nr:hypothetical protein [Methylotenera sp.]
MDWKINVKQLQNCLLALAFFFSGANVLGLVFPFSITVLLIFLSLSMGREVQFHWMQLLIVFCTWIAAIFGFMFATEYSDLMANIRQISVVTVILLVVGSLQNEVEDVLEKYFIIFTFATGVGLVLYFLAPDFYLIEKSIGSRSYLIGPSSQTLDNGIVAFSALGPYRFEGFFDEPGTYSVFSAAASFWAYVRGRKLSFAILIIATVFSESVVGLMVLTVLFIWRILLRSSSNLRLSVLALMLFLFVWAQSVDIASFADDVTNKAAFLENKALSGSTRFDQLQSVVANWANLTLPSGFSTTEVLKVADQSITSGLLRAVIPFGLVLWAIAIMMLFVGLWRTNIYSASGVLFLALITSGLSRSSLLDLAIGWFVLLHILRKKEVICQHSLKTDSLF